MQIKTHSMRQAHENIDKTLKFADAVLVQFELVKQVFDSLIVIKWLWTIAMRRIYSSETMHIIIMTQMYFLNNLVTLFKNG